MSDFERLEFHSMKVQPSIAGVIVVCAVLVVAIQMDWGRTYALIKLFCFGVCMIGICVQIAHSVWLSRLRKRYNKRLDDLCMELRRLRP